MTMAVKQGVRFKKNSNQGLPERTELEEALKVTAEIDED